MGYVVECDISLTTLTWIGKYNHYSFHYVRSHTCEPSLRELINLSAPQNSKTRKRPCRHKDVNCNDHVHT